MKIRTRFAPSPTGSLHIGGVRTAMYCYALANRHNGQFILRIEDTDQTRYVDGAEDGIYEMLEKFGIPPHESERHGGSFGPYKQSQRLELYKKYAEQLVEQGDAYYCFTTKEELEQMRQEAQERGEVFRFRSPYRDLTKSEVQKLVNEGKSYVIRQKVPANQKIVFDDPVQGKMEFDTNDVEDGVLLKSEGGFPTYHLAVVIDDHFMEITHAFRGVEWIPSTPKHILLYQAFGWTPPIIAHIPVILDPKGGKLSKRDGSVAAHEFLAEGYLPEAVLNFLMLVGWASPEQRAHGETEREFYSLQNFVDLFAIEDINKSSGVFNREKLLWFNHKYISNMQPDALTNEFLGWFGKYGKEQELKAKIIDKGPDYLEKILVLTKDRASKLSEFEEIIKPFYFATTGINFGDIKQTKNLTKDQISNLVTEFLSEMDKYGSIEAWGHEAWESFVRGIATTKNLKAGEVFMVLRVATLGSPFSPPLFESMELLGKTEVTNRLKAFV